MPVNIEEPSHFVILRGSMASQLAFLSGSSIKKECVALVVLIAPIGSVPQSPSVKFEFGPDTSTFSLIAFNVVKTLWFRNFDWSFIETYRFSL